MAFYSKSDLGDLDFQVGWRTIPGLGVRVEEISLLIWRTPNLDKG